MWIKSKRKSLRVLAGAVIIGISGFVSEGFAEEEKASVMDLLLRIERLNRGDLCGEEDGLMYAASGGSDGPKLHASFADEGARCGMFIDGQGNYGPTGLTISKAVKSDPKLKHLISDEVAKNKTIKAACPGFSGMNADQRANFWVWAHASIAWEESKCGVVMKNPDNSEAVGVFQLNKSRGDRDWRGPHCDVKSVGVEKGAADPHGKNALCALDIMLGQFKGTYGKPGGLYPYSYYKKLRSPYGGDFSRGILKKVRLHPGCSGKAEADGGMSSSKRPKQRPEVKKPVRPRPRPPLNGKTQSSPQPEFT